MIFIDKIFGKEDFEGVQMLSGEYENCTFNFCNFSELDLSGTIFTECNFIGCNLSLAKIYGSAFREVFFKDCKLLGLIFENCDQKGFVANFNSCILDNSSFYGMKLKKTKFENSALVEVDFSECELSYSVFSNSDLKGAKFENCKLEGADFRSALNYIINPQTNFIRNARFSLPNALSLLDFFGITVE